MTKIAVIDLGTNTFNLLLAEMSPSGYSIFFSEKRAVKIGQGGISKGLITKDAILRAKNAMEAYKEIIDKESINKVYVFATSAFRNASNGNDVKRELENITGFQVNIIAGDIEANYIYNGVKDALKIGFQPSLIVDIGGGSVEFIIGNDKNVFWKHSFEIGAQRLLDKFHFNDPIPENEIINIEKYLSKALDPLFKACENFPVNTLIGCSGTFDTLSEIYRSENDIEISEEATEFPLTLDAYRKIHKEIVLKNREERLQIPGMIAMRVDMIVVASCLINYVINSLNLTTIRVSAYALKEGMLDSIHAEIYHERKIML